MRTFNLLLLLSCSFYLTSCSSSKTDPVDLGGEIVWQLGDKSIKSVNGDQPYIIIKGLKRKRPLDMASSLLKFDKNGKITKVYKNEIDANAKNDNDADGLMFSGEISSFGDIDNDGVPELLLQNTTKYLNWITVSKLLLSIGDTSHIYLLAEWHEHFYSDECKNMVSKKEQFKLDSTSEEEPYLINTIEYFYKKPDNNCKIIQEAHIQKRYTMNKNEYSLSLVNENDCPIENNQIDLAKLYSYNSNQIQRIKNFRIDYDYMTLVSSKLKDCDQGGNYGLTHIENLAGIKLEGSNHKKRKDLMPFIEEEFMNVNPAFIKWGRKNLIPNPDQKQANDLLYSFIYEKAYKNRIRTLALERLIIDKEDIESLLIEYVDKKSTKFYDESTREIMTKVKTNGLIGNKFVWLYEKVKSRGFDYEDVEVYDYGFWMRRMLDGSEPEIWETLKYILQLYDGEWYQKTTWNGALEIDSIRFKQASLTSDGGKELKKKERFPKDIAISTANGVSITARNGEIVSFENNDSDGESNARYSISGYWEARKMIVVDYSGWEWGGTILVDINTGEKENLSWGIQIAKGSKRIAEWDEDYEYKSLSLSKYENSKWVSYYTTENEPMVNNIGNGFWVGNAYYFERNNYATKQSRYYKVGKFGFDEIQPYAPPIKDTNIISDSIPTDPLGEE